MSGNRIRPWLIGLTLMTLFMAIVACGGGNSIVGKWSQPGGSLVTEFTSDGKIILSESGQAITGTYTLKGNLLTGTIAEMGAPVTVTYSISGDKLTIIDPSGESIEYTRVK